MGLLMDAPGEELHMTMAIAFADRDPAVCRVSLMSDSRLTVDSERVKFAYDSYTKTRWLAAKTALVSAGESLPVNMAIESSRPMIYELNRRRRVEGQSPSSLWDDASVFIHNLKYFYRVLRQDKETAQTHVILAGFFKDGSSGLIRIRYDPDGGSIEIFRPRLRARCALVIGGDQVLQSVMIRAIREAQKASNEHIIYSAFWDILKHAGEPTESIGGGFDVGICDSSSEVFQWLPIEVEGRTFYRGVPVREMPKDLLPFKVEYDPTVYAAYERQPSDESDRTGEPIGAYFHKSQKDDGDASLLVGSEPDWRLTDCTTHPYIFKECTSCGNRQFALRPDCCSCRSAIFRELPGGPPPWTSRMPGYAR